MATSEVALARPRALESEPVNQLGRERLYPSIRNPNWPVLRSRRRIFEKWLKALSVRNPVVLDVGGRIQPYRELIPSPFQYWAVDIRSTPLVNVMGRAESMPIANESVDVVICTQMLEYASEPQTAMNEIHRVLRKNGLLLLSAPSLCPRDSEQDRWRFFPTVLRQLCSHFAEFEVVPECGSAAGLLRTFALACDISARYQIVRDLLSYSVFPFINGVGWLADLAWDGRDSSFTVNYSVCARK